MKLTPSRTFAPEPANRGKPSPAVIRRVSRTRPRSPSLRRKRLGRWVGKLILVSFLLEPLSPLPQNAFPALQSPPRRSYPRPPRRAKLPPRATRWRSQIPPPEFSVYLSLRANARCQIVQLNSAPPTGCQKR